MLHVLENNELWAIRVEPARHVTQTVDDTLFAYTLTLTLLSIRITHPRACSILSDNEGSAHNSKNTKTPRSCAAKEH